MATLNCKIKIDASELIQALNEAQAAADAFIAAVERLKQIRAPITVEPAPSEEVGK